MIAVIDTNYFITSKILTKQFEKGILTSLVYNEVKDKTSRELLSLYEFKLNIRDPSNKYLLEVQSKIQDRNILLSKADISFVALCLEMQEEFLESWIDENTSELQFLSEDNGILETLHSLNLINSSIFKPKEHVFRCHACYKIYEKPLDFCKSCGYNTVLRVTVSYTDKMVLHLKKGFKPKEKILKFGNKIIYSADQKEYSKYKNKEMKKEKEYQELYESFK